MAKHENSPAPAIIQIRTDSATKDRLLRAAVLAGGMNANLSSFLIEAGLELANGLELRNAALSEIFGAEDALLGTDRLHEIVSRAVATESSDVFINVGSDGVVRVSLRQGNEIHEDRIISAQDFGRTVFEIERRLGISIGQDFGMKHLVIDDLKMRAARFRTAFGPALSLRLYKHRKLHVVPDAVLGKMVQHQDGLIVVASSVNSGKTNACYAMLSELVEKQHGRPFSIEDPVEIQIDGVHQIQQNGNTIWELTESAVRMAPSVLFFGEIRIRDDSFLAIQHVMSIGVGALCTLHAGRERPFTATSVLERMSFLGASRELQPDLIVQPVLVTLLCEDCRANKKRVSAMGFARLNSHVLASGSDRTISRGIYVAERRKGCQCIGAPQKALYGIIERDGGAYTVLQRPIDEAIDALESCDIDVRTFLTI